MNRTLASLILALALLAIAVAQEYKGVTYTPPKGWKESVEGDAKVFVPNALKDGELFAIILTPAAPASQEDPKKQLEAIVIAANDGAKVLEKSEVDVRGGNGVFVAMQSYTLDAKDIGKHSRLYVLVISGKQLTLAMVLMNSEALLERYGESAMEFIGSIGFKSDSGPAAVANPSVGKIPTGNTPDVFPGSPGWLPSGKGLKIPQASISDGKPSGLWWKTQVATGGLLKPVIHIYLEGNIRASNPRLGGGWLYDHEGQRQQKGFTGVGTFSVGDGQIVERYDGFVNTARYQTGKDEDGIFFKADGAMFRPLIPFTEKTILGHWRGPGADYKFFADGTFQYGSSASNGDWTAFAGGSGTYVLDGFLIQFKPATGPGWIDIVGLGGKMMAKGSTFLFRVQ